MPFPVIEVNCYSCKKSKRAQMDMIVCKYRDNAVARLNMLPCKQWEPARSCVLKAINEITGGQDGA